MRRTIALFALIFAISQANAQSFVALKAAVESADPADRAQLVSDFLASTTKPHFENDTTAVFLWQGSASSMLVTGDFTGWSSQGRTMERLSTTNLWYRIDTFEADARLDYKFIRSGSSWILDPANPLRVPGGFGPNSELAMPGYVQPWEIEEDPAAAKGQLDSHTFASSIMGNSRQVQVYLPAGYDASRSEAYPVILYHDGSDYTNLASIKNTLDNLIHQEQVEPIVAIFVNPLNREAEYATSSTTTFTRLIVEELIPWVEANYHVSTVASRRAVTGPSYAGLASARHCFEHPEVFGLCAPYSPSFWVSGGALLNEMSQADLSNIKWYVEWGTYEGSITTTGAMFEGILTQHGATYKANVWNEGHSWGMWRAHQDDMLTFFFPGANATSRSQLDLPKEKFGLELYPNPTSSKATVVFSLPAHGPVRVSLHDILGREVSLVFDESLPAGEHRVALERPAKAAGMYWVRVASDSHAEQAGLMMLR